MKIRIYQLQEWTGETRLTQEIDVPVVDEAYVDSTLFEILPMSDRAPSFPVDDPRGWAYNAALRVTVGWSAWVDPNSNTINLSFANYSNWTFYRNKGATPNGYRVVRGNYYWYSSVNGREIYHYVGPTTSGEADYEVGGLDGGSWQMSLNIPPETESQRYEFANIYNAVSGVRSRAYICFYNDLPADYRPGERKIDGVWKSLNRNGGVCERNASWYEMRTVGGASGATGDPPERKINGVWTNQSKIGEE